MPKSITPLTEKQRRFVEAYAATGNATKAAEMAGYKHPNVQGPDLVKVSAVANAIAALAARSTKATVASRERRLELLTQIAEGTLTEIELSLSGDPNEKPPKIRDRIAAMELIAKMNGELVKKTELTGKDGGPLQLERYAAMTEAELRAEALRLAGGKS